MNEKNEFLMVLQGKVNEEKRWSVPSGGQEELEECCVREVCGKKRVIKWKL